MSEIPDHPNDDIENQVHDADVGEPGGVGLGTVTEKPLDPIKQPPSVSPLACLGFLLAFLLFLGALIAAVVYLVWLLIDEGINKRADQAELNESPKEKYAYVASAFSGDIKSDPEHVRLASKLFERLDAFRDHWQNLDTTDPSDKIALAKEFDELIHAARMETQIIRMRSAFNLQPITAQQVASVDNYVFERQLDWFTDMLAHQSAQIAAVRPIGNGEELVIYAKVTHPDGYDKKVRVWVKKRSNQYSIFDIELLRDAFRFSIQIGIELTGTKMAMSIEEAARIDDSHRLLRQLSGRVFEVTRNGQTGESNANPAQLSRFVDQIDPETLDPYRQKDYWMLKSQVYMLTGNYQQALEATGRLKARFPVLPQVEINNAEIYRRMGAFDQAITGCKNYQEMMGPDAEAQHLLGQVYRDMNRPTLAKTAFEQALQYNPSHSRARDALRQLAN